MKSPLACAADLWFKPAGTARVRRMDINRTVRGGISLTHMMILLKRSAVAAFLALSVSAALCEPVTPAVSRQVQPFPLEDVRLLNGPFRDAMFRDYKYLLSLDPDRLLYTFRLNVGLTSPAKPLGGWEGPDVELRGHTIGHYLSALSLMYASTGDEQLKHRVDYIVGELAQCQDHSPAAGFHDIFPRKGSAK